MIGRLLAALRDAWRKSNEVDLGLADLVVTLDNGWRRTRRFSGYLEVYMYGGERLVSAEERAGAWVAETRVFRFERDGHPVEFVPSSRVASYVVRPADAALLVPRYGRLVNSGMSQWLGPWESA